MNLSRKIRSIVSGILSAVLIAATPLSALADIPGGSLGQNVPIPKSTDSGFKPKAGIFQDYGFRITVTTAHPIEDAGIQKLSGNYSAADVAKQRTDIENISNTRYWESGDYGIYFYKGNNRGIKPNFGITSTSPGDGYNIKNNRIKMVQGQVGCNDNALSWMMYPGIDGYERTGDVPYVEAIGTLVHKPTSVTSGDMWLSNMREVYKANKGPDILPLMQRVFSDGNNTANNLQEFTWDTSSMGSAGDVSGQARVLWSQLGQLGLLVQLAWLAQDTHNDATYESIKDALWAWACSGYDAESAPILLIEACQEISLDGTPTAADSNCLLATLPYTLNSMYGTDIAAQLFSQWPADCESSTEKAIQSIVGTRNAIDGAVMGQSVGYYFAGGKKIPKYADRAYCRLLWPTTRSDSVYGYLVGFSYYADGGLGSDVKPTLSNANGKFTWELSPHGVVDRAQNKEINAPSTISNLNISQNATNMNNYSQWEQRVRGDAYDTNKIKISIYRTSEPLASDKQATEYTRGQVKVSGKPITTPVDRVTIGNGLIGNIPGIGTLMNDTPSDNLTDDQLLNILKTGTGLTYTETIAGPLVDGETPKGIRVTYAVYVDVSVGGTKWEALDNNQAEYIEYRAEPGTYTYTSDDPEGYAEIKCGYFSGEKGYSEPFEAMAGCPTTNNLYFVSGGQEFVAQIKYKYVTDKDAVRTFEQKYTTETSSGFFTSGVFYDTGANGLHQSEINSCIDWTTHIENVNCKTCPECGYEHFAGANAHEKAYATSYSGSGVGTTFTVPGAGLWDVYDVQEFAWDWSAPSVSNTYKTDDKGHTTIDKHGGPGGTVSDSPTQPAPLTYEAGTSTFSKTKATRWTFKVRANYQDSNDGRTSVTGDPKATQLTSSIKWNQHYNDMNYAKIQEAHVWRLEKARVEGIRQLTFEQDDSVLAGADELANVIFNVAETDTANEGRMFYALHSANRDDFKFTDTLKTRGCSVCHNHCAAEDLIASKENPNNMYENAWCVSDYLALQGYNAKTSLLYHEYATKNGDNKDKPILKIRVSGTDKASRQDNGYYVYEGSENEKNEISEAETFRGFDKKSVPFDSQVVSYNTYANTTEGTQEKVCENSETFVNRVSSHGLSWAGYNGRGPNPSESPEQRVQTAPDDLGTLDKYSGKRGVNNFSKISKAGSTVVDGKTVNLKKIFLPSYVHDHNGEVGGFSTQSPQKWKDLMSPFMLVVNDIDVHDVKVPNGEKSFHDSSIFYHNIISYKGGAIHEENANNVYKDVGFVRDTNYSKSHEGINEIVIHNPVSVQYAKLTPLPSELDQRVDTKLIIDSLNIDNGKCPGKASECKYAHLNCKYDGVRYWEDKDYVEVRGTGLATLPYKGGMTTTLQPVVTTVTKKGSKQFGYTGGMQSFTAPVEGRYTFDIYGAQGGGNANSAGKGGYTKGDIYLRAGQSINVNVGGAGGAYYGGYNGGGHGSRGAWGGGGMTTVNLPDSTSTSKRYVHSDPTKWKVASTYTPYVRVVSRRNNTWSYNTDFTLEAGHDYVIGYTNKDSYNKDRGMLCDITTGYCLSQGYNWHPPANSRYPVYRLDLYADKINDKGDAGLVDKRYALVAGGGGGAGPYKGGDGGGLEGGYGARGCGSPGSPGTQTTWGYGGDNHGTEGGTGYGGVNTTTSNRSGGGGGGGGYYGGGGGGDDFAKYVDLDDSGGGGGSGFISKVYNSNGVQLVTNASTTAGQRLGNGLVNVTWSIESTETVYVPITTGKYEYDTTQGDILPMEMKPHVYTAPEAGYYSIHLYGGAGGGADAGQPSAGGRGGYAGGQIYLTAGQRVLVTAGGTGSNGSTPTIHNLSGGYNGGGTGGNGDGGGFGGGGATDIALKFTYDDLNKISTNTAGGILRDGVLDLTPNNAFYWGPRMTSTAGHIYRVDYYGENLDKATYDSLAYTTNWNSNVHNNATLIHSSIFSEHAQLFYRVNTTSLPLGQEFRVFGNGAAKLKEVYVVDMNDRIMVAGGGGGADNGGGVLNGLDDGRGGNGGGVSGEDGYTNGVRDYHNSGAKSTSGFAQGIGEDATTHDNGGGGGGWYGGSKGQDGNSGGGGGSSYLGTMQNAVTSEGQNSGAGYAIIVKPGKGDVPVTHKLSCNEPHKAPNSNWHRYVEGWKYADDGQVCTGMGYIEGRTLLSPAGVVYTPDTLNNNTYIVKHDGVYDLTIGPDKHDDCLDQDVTFERYSLDNKAYQDCCWKSTSYDAACFDTSGATNPIYHYAFGDATCYDPCLDDSNHKLVVPSYTDPTSPDRSGQFVVLDHNFEIYFPNTGDFYGDGAFGIKVTQKPEGWGYTDAMDTTLWLKEKYVQFPFDVTYKGHTYLSGEKVMLGVYDQATYTWKDDSPADYKYAFHCLLSDHEMAAAKVRFVAIAKNTPASTLENKVEDRNYTRYSANKNAFHDAYRDYFIDVLGRIGVMSIEDTGDFRFSNYYKQALEGWQVDQVTHKVDLSKQNFVSVDQKTIFGDPITKDTKGQNTWGLTKWLEPLDKLRPFPLTPGENNVKALKNQAHRIGYSDYLSLMTIGDYYGENQVADRNSHKVQIQPYYYYYNLTTKEWVPMDVYIKDGDTYKLINKYGSTDPTTDYQFNYNLNWEAEKDRRMYTKDEEAATKSVQDSYYVPAFGTEDLDPPTPVNIAIPGGTKYLHGTANMLFLRDGNRTFVGSRDRYGDNTEIDGRIPEVAFQRQAQRWHFTLGLPSTATFVRKGEPCTPENIKKYDMDKGVILCALDVLSQGKVWTLRYDGVPAGERSFYLFGNKTTLVSWEGAGENGPQDKPVVVVYTNAKTSRDDLGTEGTH